MSNVKIIYPDVPVRAAAHTSSATFSDTAPISNLDDGRRDNNAAVTSSPTEVIINHDLGSGNTASVDHLVVARADNVTVSGSVMVRGSSVSRFAPSSIAGLTAWFDANRGTTVDADNLVGQWNDLSGNGYNASQATTANKPILSRTDTKENLVIKSEDIADAYWLKQAVGTGVVPTVTGNTGLSPAGTVTADRIQLSLGGGTTTTDRSIVTSSITLFANSTFEWSVYLKSNTASNYNVQIRVANGASVVTVTPAWQRFTVTGSTAGGDTTSPAVWLRGGQTPACSNTADILMWGAQLTRSGASTDYVSTNNYPVLATINGNRAIFFDGTDDNLRADALATPFSGGQDYPLTIFFVSNAFQAVSPGNATFLGFGREAANTGWLFARVDTGNRTVSLRDDAATIKTPTFGAPTGATVQVHSIVMTGTQATWYVNGSVVGTANQDIDVGVSTRDRFCIGAERRNAATANFFRGLISEVIIYSTALSSTNRQTVEAYLTSKWQTAPVVNISNFNSQTLYGTRAKDFITTFSPSTAYRHWWIEFLGVTAFKPSKIYLGTDFDPVNSPDYSWRLIVPSEAKFTSGSGEIRANRTATPRYTFELFWEGLTDAEVNTFAEKIWAKKHKSGFFLYTSAQPQILDNKTLVHVRCISAEWERVGKANYNVLRAVFEELV